MSLTHDYDLKVIEAFIDDVLAAGHTLSLDDGEELAIDRSTDKGAILEALEATSEETLIVRRANGERIGAAFLVYGNEPGVVICDNTDTPEMNALLARAEAIGEKLAEG